jgi:hypothetical protein
MGAHQSCRVGRPRSGRELKAQLGRWAELDEINTNNLSLDLILLLKLNLLHLFLFHLRSVHRACLVITVSAIRLNSYNTPLYFETDS